MKKYLSLVFFTAIVLYGCKKSDVKVEPIIGKWTVKADTVRSYHPGNALPFSTTVISSSIGDTYQYNAGGTGILFLAINSTSAAFTYSIANGALTLNYTLNNSIPSTSTSIIKKITSNELVLYYEHTQSSNPHIIEMIYLTR